MRRRSKKLLTCLLAASMSISMLGGQGAMVMADIIQTTAETEAEEQHITETETSGQSLENAVSEAVEEDIPALPAALEDDEDNISETTTEEPSSEAKEYQVVIERIYRNVSGEIVSNEKATVDSLNGQFTYVLEAETGYTVTNVEFSAVENGKLEDGQITGVAAEDAVVTVTLEEDKIGEADPDAGDGIADRYQVIFTYITDGNGIIRQGEKEVVTRRDASGDLSETAAVSPRGEALVRGNEGYEFVFWADSQDNIYLSAEELRRASYEEDMTFTAMFIISYYDYFYNIEYYYDNVLERTEDSNLARINAVINSYPDGSKRGFALDQVENFPLVVGESPESVIRVYYATDVKGAKGQNASDGIPDKYQISFTYTSGKGAAISGDTSELAVRLDGNGNWSQVDGAYPSAKVELQVEEDMELLYWQTSVTATNGINRFETLKDLRQAAFTEDVTVTAVLGEIVKETPGDEIHETSDVPGEDGTDAHVEKDADKKNDTDTKKAMVKEPGTEDTLQSTEEVTSEEETEGERSYEVNFLEDQQTPLGGGSFNHNAGSVAWKFILPIALIVAVVGAVDILRRQRHINKLRKMFKK